jgi:hypothetical protein
MAVKTMVKVSAKQLSREDIARKIVPFPSLSCVPSGTALLKRIGQRQGTVLLCISHF